MDPQGLRHHTAARKALRSKLLGPGLASFCDLMTLWGWGGGGGRVACQGFNDYINAWQVVSEWDQEGHGCDTL